MSIKVSLRLKISMALFLAVLVLIAYRGVVENDFIAFDDPQYVSGNHRVQQGLTLETIRWAFTTTHIGNWHPLTWLSLLLDGTFFKMNPAGYHWTSVILHLLGGLMLFAALSRMTSSLWGSGFVAALFLIHPLHVESVAWVAERKDVLSGLFWMTGLWCYARYVERPGIARYLWMVGTYAACLLAKPMGVTFPFVLLLLDFWPLRRTEIGKVGWASLVYEKIPLFFLSAAASAITFIVQRQSDALYSLLFMPLGDRLANATVSYATYLVKMVWPAGLSIYYPYNGPPSLINTLCALALIVLVTVLSVLQYKRRPYLLVGWLWYVGTLVPVIGIVQVGSQAMADRYTYLPLVGIFIMAVWGTRDLLAGRPWQKGIGGLLAAVLVVILVFLTQVQVGYWKDTPTLFGQALRNTERNFMAHQILAEWMTREGDLMNAETHFREAIRIKPSFKQAHNSLGHLLMIKGNQEEAAGLLERTLKIDPNFVPAMKNLGDVRMRQRRLKDALHLYQKALQQGGQEDPELWNNYGVALFFDGKKKEAIQNIREAIRLNPDYSDARNNLQKIMENPENLK